MYPLMETLRQRRSGSPTYSHRPGAANSWRWWKDRFQSPPADARGLQLWATHVLPRGAKGTCDGRTGPRPRSHDAKSEARTFYNPSLLLPGVLGFQGRVKSYDLPRTSARFIRILLLLIHCPFRSKPVQRFSVATSISPSRSF
jgi:hypothetical protein